MVKKYLKSAATLFLFKLISIGPCFGLSSEVLRINVSQEIAKLPEVKILLKEEIECTFKAFYLHSK